MQKIKREVSTTTVYAKDVSNFQDILINDIVQAYETNNHVQLKNLMEEVFLQPFSDSEYESFIYVFKKNKWTWESLIKKFNDATYKRNVFQYVLCKPY